MTDDITIKTDEELKSALFKLFDLAELEPPTMEITGRDVMMAVKEIQQMIQSGGGGGAVASASAPQSASQPSSPLLGGMMGGGSGDDPFANLAGELNPNAAGPKQLAKDRNILIVGELGIVTYQLKLALTRHGSEVTIVKGVDEAVTEYKKRPYTDVLIDVFMPTEREGLIVLMEIKRLALEKGVHTNIVVIATPVKEKRVDLKEICKQRGATLFLQKTEGWHQRVINFFTGVPES